MVPKQECLNVYDLGASSSHNNDPPLKNCLFGAVSLAKNADIDRYGFSGYGNGFDRRSIFSFPNGGFGQNVLIFFFFFLSGFSFTNIHDSRDSRGRGRVSI